VCDTSRVLLLSSASPTSSLCDVFLHHSLLHIQADVEVPLTVILAKADRTTLSSLDYAKACRTGYRKKIKGWICRPEELRAFSNFFLWFVKIFK
jgi:hypothetical protein